MVQFTKAMRDEKGEMVRNAHILGFFRRICKLLFLRTKPVFVFDGGTPALKRRTVAARRRRRENARAKIRKTAEKLLLNHLKAKKLEELALELKNSKQKADAEGKRVMVDGESCLGEMDLEEKHGAAADATSQEKLDEMLAASLAAEEEGKLIGTEPSSASGVMDDENNMEEENKGEEEEEEMIFPVTSGNIDPTVLASLPPSMQLDLLVQMRERLIAENRQKYQKFKTMPAKFSELQIQSYLKTVAFRRELDEVQKIASGRGVGGMQTSRIASESNREFIFSSSFTGDKQTLTPAAVQDNGEMTSHTMEEQPLDSGNLNSSTDKLKFVSQACVGEHLKGYGDDVENFLDVRSRIQVSRVGGVGLHMTRDLQRNLALMKENKHDNSEADDLDCAAHVTNDGNIVSVSEDNAPIRPGKSNVCSEGILEISFSKEDYIQNDTGDDLFTNLVAGNSITSSSFGITPSEDLSDEPEFDNIWEEGRAADESNNICIEREPSHGDTTLEEGNVDWEEGICNIPVANLPYQSENNRTISRGNMEEESDIQEAIRRSLEDLHHKKPNALNEETSEAEVNPSLLPHQGTSGQSFSSQSTMNGYDEMVYSARKDGLTSSMIQLSSIIIPEDNNDANIPVVDEVKQMVLASSGTCTKEKVLEKPRVSNAFDEELKALNPNSQQMHDNQSSKEEDLFINDVGRSATQQNDDDEFPIHGNDIQGDLDVAKEELQTVDKEDKLATLLEASQAPAISFLSEDQTEMRQGILDEKNHREAMKDQTTLENEISYLRQECEQIGDEQRKLERNAESVSSEMFAECQELLQMFGLPYIIAPMEAEAQCAHMELINLVDGVVTDDSDVFLFGAHNVYKNLFDDRKYVETYFLKDVENELGLTREKLIRMALLLGSDYTEGVSGIGIVNAIEVVNAFPEDDGLQKFKEWVESPDPSILGKLDRQAHTSIRSLGKTCSNNDKLEIDLDIPSSDDNSFFGTCEQSDGISEAKKFFMSKHRNISKNWHIPSSFPSESVISAYITPQVDESTEPFSWGKPDLSLLRKLCWERFGWSNQKADELLLPVLKEYNKHETQLRLEAFYSFNERFAKIRSQRIKKAVKGITGKLSVELSSDPAGPAQTSASSQKGKNSRSKQSKEKILSGELAQTSAASQKWRDYQSKKLQTEQNHSGRNTGKQFKRNRFPSKSSEQEHLESINENKKQKRGTKGQGKKRSVGNEQNFHPTVSDSSDDEDINREKPVQATEAMSMSCRPAKQEKRRGTEENNQNFLPGSSARGNCNEVLIEEVLAASDGNVPEDNSLQDCRSHSLEESMPMHLLNGGGFCIDDKNSIGVESIPKVSSPGKASSLLSNAIIDSRGIASNLNTNKFSDEDNLIPRSDKDRRRSTAATEGKDWALSEATSPETENSQRESGSSVLSVMPSLRRKRKKF